VCRSINEIDNTRWRGVKFFVTVRERMQSSVVPSFASCGRRATVFKCIGQQAWRDCRGGLAVRLAVLFPDRRYAGLHFRHGELRVRSIRLARCRVAETRARRFVVAVVVA
jgi:hypothetical protein